MKDPICADTSVWVAFFAAEDAVDVHALDRELQRHAVFMSPVVLSELLSAPNLPESGGEALRALPRLEVLPEFWVRAGGLRRRLLKRKEGYRPKLADTLIAQLCLDYSIPLLTRDRDFEGFATHEGLALVRA